MGLFKKIKKVAKDVYKGATFQKNPFKQFDKFVNQDLGGWGNVLQGAGIVAAGVLTGGVAAAGLTAVGAAGAGMAVGAGALAGAGMAVGSVDAGIQQAKAERQAAKDAAAAQAEANKANDLAERQRRASLYSLRRQVGVRNVGANTAIRGGTSTTVDTQKAMAGIVLG